VSELLPWTAADIVNSKQHECKYSYFLECICHRARIGGCASLAPSEVLRKRSPMLCMHESGPEQKSPLDGRVPNQDDVLEKSVGNVIVSIAKCAWNLRREKTWSVASDFLLGALPQNLRCRGV